MVDTSKAEALLKAASPGPWKDSGHSEIRDADGDFLAAFWQASKPSPRRQRGNARLAALAREVTAYAIAATEALGAMLEEYSGNDETDLRWNLLQNAGDTLADWNKLFGEEAHD